MLEAIALTLLVRGVPSDEHGTYNTCLQTQQRTATFVSNTDHQPITTFNKVYVYERFLLINDEIKIYVREILPEDTIIPTLPKFIRSGIVLISPTNDFFVVTPNELAQFLAEFVCTTKGA